VASASSVCSVAVRLVCTLSEFVDEVPEAPKEVQALANDPAYPCACFGHITLLSKDPLSTTFLQNGLQTSKMWSTTTVELSLVSRRSLTTLKQLRRTCCEDVEYDPVSLQVEAMWTS
jgi:hypothetical protein